MAKAKLKSIAVLTGGGDCPGLNAVIRAVTKTAIARYGMTVWGIQDGYLGLIEGRINPLTYEDTSNILTAGGTILGTSNTSNPFKFLVEESGKMKLKDVSGQCMANLKERGIEALVCPSDEFEEKGLPVTYKAQEYF